MNPPALTVWTPHAVALLRIVTALLFVQHGLSKLFGFPVPTPGVPDPLPTLLVMGAWMEVVGGSLVALGLLTRPVAFLLSGEMAVAYWLAHAPQGPWPIANMGEPAIMFCFVFLTLVFTGAGAWSVDELLGDRMRVDA